MKFKMTCVLARILKRTWSRVKLKEERYKILKRESIIGHLFLSDTKGESNPNNPFLQSLRDWIGVIGRLLWVEVVLMKGSFTEVSDWRALVPARSRQRMVCRTMDTLKRHLPFSGDEGIQELKKISERFEDKIYSGATSQADYLQKMSLKMLSMENRQQNLRPD